MADLERERGARFTASTGVVLKVGRAPAWAITEVLRQEAANQPQPPLVHNPDRDRDEENEADPAYVAAVKAHDTHVIERQYEVAVILGTSLESCPDDVPHPESDGWRDALAAVGIPLSDDPKRRYLEWVKYIAVPANDDWMHLNALLTRQIGTTEEDVNAAFAAFRRDPEWRADRTGVVEQQHPDGDTVRTPVAGASTLVRRVRERPSESLSAGGMGGP